MAKKAVRTGGLFDLFDQAQREEWKEQKPDPKTCDHPSWQMTTTVWPGETCERLTETCERCGYIRGRMRLR